MRSEKPSIKNLVSHLERSKDKYLELVRKTYNYKIPSGYLGWTHLSAVIALGIISKNVGYWEIDRATFLHGHKCRLWFVKSAPVYCLKDDLLEKFSKTDVHQSLLQDLKPQLPSFILLLPKGKIVSPEGYAVNFFIVHVSDRNFPENSQGIFRGIEADYLPHEHDINIHFSTVDTDGNVWFSGMGLYPDGSIQFEDGVDGGIEQKDVGFLESTRSLVLQCLLFMQYEREALTGVLPAEVRGVVGFGGTNIEKQKALYPRWLRDASSEPKSKKVVNRGEHGSPMSHWRRGHWRQASVGEKRAEKKVIWIRPTFVNPDYSK